MDRHAYAILECKNDVAGNEGIDLIKLRNPWGKGEFEIGEWDDDGPGWEKHPDVKAALNPIQLDDGELWLANCAWCYRYYVHVGIFWVSKDEFFTFYDMVYLCALDMNQWIHSK